jgi:hypothetical protein
MNDGNTSACRFSAEIVAYMYAELSVVDASAFESHLLNCGDCTDEFAEISGARFEVYEWKKLAFDPLATPEFDIPLVTETVAAVSTISWVEKLRIAFGHTWLTPAVAFGGLLIVSIFAGSFILSRDEGVDVASNHSNASATPEAAIENAPEKSAPPTRIEAPDERDTATSTAVEAPASAPVYRRRDTRSVRTVRPPAIEAKSASAQNTPTNPPRLNEFAEDEDTSLRLAEMFDDIDTSE